MLSRESEYGLQGLMILARRPQGTVMLLKQIAAASHLPAGFLARIFQKLRRHGLVASHRGAVRGYALARPAREIRLRGIFEAIEGPNLFDSCIFSPRRCNARERCSLHDEWTTALDSLRRMTDETSLADAASRGTAPP